MARIVEHRSCVRCGADLGPAALGDPPRVALCERCDLEAGLMADAADGWIDETTWQAWLGGFR